MSEARLPASHGSDADLLQQMNEDLLAAVAELRTMIDREEDARRAKHGPSERAA